MRPSDDRTKSSNESARQESRVTDFNNSLRYIRCLLRLLGVWPLVASGPMKIEYAFSKRVLLPLVSLSMMSLTMPVCYYVVARPIDRIETIVLLGPITCQISNILIHLAMIVRSGLIKVCMEHMKHDWQMIGNSKEHDIMERYSRFSRALTIVCLLFMYTGALSYSLIMPLLSGNTLNEMNETVRPRPFPGTEIFFDVQANAVYEIVFSVNFFSALLHYTVPTAICVLAIVLVSHACGQIQIVVSNLDGFVDRVNANESDANSIGARIGLVVRGHVRLLKFAKNIERTLREVLLIEVLATTLIICFIEYNVLLILKSDDSDRMGVLTYVMLFVSFAFNLFLYCLFGEVLKGQCERIGTKAYLIDWPGLPGKTKLALVMIMNIGNYPYKLTAGGIMELSVVNFVSILKTSFAYFNMMRTMG